MHLINIDGDLQAVLDALSAIGTVTTPHDRTPRLVCLDAPPEAHDAIEAIVGVCSCCDADKPVELTAIQMFTEPGEWGPAVVSGEPQDQYGYLTPGPLYFLDTEPSLAWISNAEIIHGELGIPNDHATGTTFLARTIAKNAPIYVANGFPSGSGTSLSVNLGLAAIADHAEDNPPVRKGVANYSFEDTSPTNPFAANMARIAAANVLQVASSGNGINNVGVNLNVTPRWPANAADVIVGAHDKNYARSGFSNYPCAVHAAGEAVQFKLVDGSTTDANGTSISAPLFSAALRRAYDEGHDLAWLLAQSRDVLTNIPLGPLGVLHYPTTEVNAPPPPPPPNPVIVLGDIAMQFTDSGSNQPIPSAPPNAVDLAFDGSVEHVVPTGWDHIMLRAHSIVSSNLPTNATANLRIVDSTGAIVLGALDREAKAGVGSLYLNPESVVIPVNAGDTFKVQAWHDGGSGITFNSSAGGVFEMRNAT
jgi:hypothetical protein